MNIADWVGGLSASCIIDQIVCAVDDSITIPFALAQ